MVAAFIFILHIVAAGCVFWSQRRKGGTSEGVLAVGFVAIVFAVGWTIATMLTNLLFTPEFFVRWYYAETDSVLLRVLRLEFSRDTIPLLILTFAESAFYYLFLRTPERENTDPS